MCRFRVTMGEVWIKADKPLKEYPTGTKAKALGGGYWIKTGRGWKWSTGSTFPSVGGDWSGEVCLPVFEYKGATYTATGLRQHKDHHSRIWIAVVEYEDAGGSKYSRYAEEFYDRFTLTTF